MATDYGLLCRTCGEFSDTWVRRNFEQVVDLVRCTPLINEVLAKVAAAEFPWFIQVQVSYSNLEHDPPHIWIGSHAGHDMVVVDGYGEECPYVRLPAGEEVIA